MHGERYALLAHYHLADYSSLQGHSPASSVTFLLVCLFVCLFVLGLVFFFVFFLHLVLSSVAIFYCNSFKLAL